jgi:hypothetical protein
MNKNESQNQDALHAYARVLALKNRVGTLDLNKKKTKQGCWEHDVSDYLTAVGSWVAKLEQPSSC